MKGCKMNNENNNIPATNNETVAPSTPSVGEVQNQNVNNPQEVAINNNVQATQAQPATQTAPVSNVENGAVEVTPVVSNTPKVEEQVLYNIKENKGGNPFGVILFFAAIFVGVYFLPTISEELSKFIPGINSISGPSPISQKEKKEEEKKPEEKEKENDLYDLNGAISNAIIDKIQLGNFVKDNKTGDNRLDFYILNNGEDVFTFNDNTKFYLDLYNNQTYISSALVYSYKDIAPKESINFSVIISNDAYKRANKFKIVRKNTNEYDSVQLNKQEGDYRILNCSYKNNSINYYFLNNYLEIIEDTYNENKNNLNYYQDLEKYRNDATIYESYPDIDYNVIESSEEFNVKTRLELEKINDSDLKRLAIYKYFSYHKESKVVSFEMTSLGYSCS